MYMLAYAVIGTNCSGGEGSINNCKSSECWEDKNCKELSICEPSGFESGVVAKIGDKESKLVEKMTAEKFDYNTVEASAAQGEVINYYAPLEKVDTNGRSWCVEDTVERSGYLDEGSEASLLSIPPLQLETIKPLCEEEPLVFENTSEAKDLGVEDFENGKVKEGLPASIEDLRKANSVQRHQCGAILALCREQEEGRRLAQACASLLCGEINSGQDSSQPIPVGGATSHLGPYQQWLAREMVWSVKLPPSIGQRSSESLSDVQYLLRIM